MRFKSELEFVRMSRLKLIGDECFSGRNSIGIGWYRSESGWGIDSAATLKVIKWVDIRDSWRFLEDRGGADHLQYIPHVLRSFFGFLRKHLADDVIEFGRNVIVADEKRWDGRREVLREKFVGGVARVGSFASNQFIDHASHGVDIASGVECSSANLLWGHVRAGSFDFCFTRKEFSKSSFDFLGDGKVDEFDFPFSAQQDVIGFDIAVNVAFGVQIIESFGGLFDDARKFVSDRFRATSHGHFQVHFAEEF